MMQTKNKQSKPAKIFLSLQDIKLDHYHHIFSTAKQLKQDRFAFADALKNKTIAMIFEKASTRTRISFEVGIQQLGGTALFLSKNDLQLNRGEPMEHTAIVLSSMVEGVLLRCSAHQDLKTLVEHTNIPIINGLSDYLHPCQLLADLFALMEHGLIFKNSTICFAGNASENMCNSYIEASYVFGFKLHIACANSLKPNADVLKKWGKNTHIFNSAIEAAKNCDAVVTDVWKSMGSEISDQSIAELKPLQVTKDVMAAANSDAKFLHCLPMHLGEEVTKEVAYSDQSIIWQAAENRLHSQKALLLHLFNCINN